MNLVSKIRIIDIIMVTRISYYQQASSDHIIWAVVIIMVIPVSSVVIVVVTIMTIRNICVINVVSVSAVVVPPSVILVLVFVFVSFVSSKH